MLLHSALSSVAGPIHGGKRGALWAPLLLTSLFVLFALPHSAASAQNLWTCDIPIPGIHSGYACRPVPEYFYENRAAERSWAEEIDRRKQEGTLYDPETEEYNMPTLAGSGYQCPDAMGNCFNEFVPSPAGTDGLSNPASYSGSSGFDPLHTGYQRVNGAGIGVQSIVDQRPIDAVDVWGEGAQGGGEVCFLGEGRIMYLDARTSPRAQSTLATYTRGGEGEQIPLQTCATMPGPGTVVFLPLQQ